MPNKVTKVTRGISLDEALVEVADQLLPNRSEAAQSGLLEAVKEKIKTLNPELQKEYEGRIAHLD